MHIFSIGVREVQQAQSSTTRIANKLSSGNRLHKLGTDSAGLSVSSRQKSDIATGRKFCYELSKRNSIRSTSTTFILTHHATY